MKSTATSRPSARHVLNAWRRATAERAHGSVWYAIARDVMADMAQARGLDVATVAGITAALSPQLAWARNLEATRLVLDGGRPAAVYGANLAKARRILRGEAPEVVLGGNKVRSFYRLLRDGGNHWDVCVDGHAWQVAVGRLEFGAHAPELRYPAYVQAAGAYRAVARQLGVEPHVVQATVWLWHRRRLDEMHAQGRRLRVN